MDESQRRTTGANPAVSGHRFKLIAVMILALSAVGFVAVWSRDFHPAALLAEFTDGACQHRSDTTGLALYPCAASPPVHALSSAALHAREGLSGSPQSGHPAFEAAGNLAGTGPNDSGRQRHLARADSPVLDSGYTLAELCAATSEGTQVRCQTTDPYDDSAAFKNSRSSAKAPAGLTISGHARAADTGAGVPGVPIFATLERLQGSAKSPAAATLRFRTLTDSEGAYTLKGLPDGEYAVHSSNHDAYQAAHISARAGIDYADLALFRNSVTVVTGRVLSADGGPLEGVTVLPLALGQPSVLTGDDGRFSLPVGVKASVAVVTLRFQRPGYGEIQKTVQIRPDALPTAQAVANAGLNVTLQPVDTWTSLDGTVVSESGDTVGGRVVELKPSSGPYQRTTTDKTGRFEFPMLESPANYRLSVYGGDGYRDYQQMINLTAETASINVTLQPYEYGAVSGQLLNVSGEPVPDFELVLRNTGSQQPNALVTSDESGNFALPAVPAGELVVASQSTPSILVQGLHLASGEKLNLPLVIDWGPHELHGIVLDANNNPVPARVVLHWSRETDGITTNATRRTSADIQGQFAFSQLGPGPHSLRVDAPGYRTVALDHDLQQQGYTVTVRLN